MITVTTGIHITSAAWARPCPRGLTYDFPGHSLPSPVRCALSALLGRGGTWGIGGSGSFLTAVGRCPCSHCCPSGPSQDGAQSHHLSIITSAVHSAPSSVSLERSAQKLSPGESPKHVNNIILSPPLPLCLICSVPASTLAPVLFWNIPTVSGQVYAQISARPPPSPPPALHSKITL